MKRPPAPLSFLLVLLGLCLAVFPLNCALAQNEAPAQADTLLYKHFAGELMLFDFNVKSYECTTRSSVRERDTEVDICTWNPTEKIEYEVEYHDGSPVRYTLRVYTGSTTEMDQETLFALAAFAMTFIDHRQEMASQVIETLMANAQKNNGFVHSIIEMIDMTVHWVYDGAFAHLSVIPV